MEKNLLLIATLCGFIVVTIKLPNFDETSIISIVSGLIFGSLYFYKLKKK